MENKDDNAMLAESMGYKLVDDTETTTENVETTTENVEKKESTEIVDTKSSLKENSDTPESSEEKSEPDSFDSLLREKSEGKFQSYDDLIKSFDDTQKEKKDLFANETIEKLNQYILDGGNVDDFNKTQINYSDMSDVDVVKEGMRLNDPDLSDNDIDFLLKREYRLDEEEYDEDEVRISKLKLRKDAKEFKGKLEEWQKKYEITQNLEHQKNISDKTKENEEAAKVKHLKEKERWENLVADTTSKFDKVDFEINDKGEKFTFKLSDEDKSALKSTNSDLSKFWSRFMNEDGTENMEKLNKTMYIVDNYNKIIRAVANQYKSSGKDDVLKDIKNPDYNVNNSDTSSELKSIQQQMYDAWKKGN